MNHRAAVVILLGVLGATCGATYAGVARGFPGLPYMLELDIDADSWDAQGDPSNTVLTFDLSDMLIEDSMLIMNVTGVEWNLTVETFGASWLSEASLALQPGDGGPDGPTVITPGLGNDFPGLSTFSSAGLVEFSGGDIVLLPTGVLEIELFESFDDLDDFVDAHVSGSITVHGFAIPTPGTMPVLMGVGVLAARRSRR